ncbi:DUF2785 domain-containing protein [Paenibacillus sp. A14]|uniref:DUF2785 domain-containing protein n=1 Tax=Paenibacillus sp. A14 TaxID=3119820 RepID=UPI002FE3095B
MDLKQLLKDIRERDYKIPEGVDAELLVQEMLCEIGSIDSELRDDLIYFTFYQWIQRNALSPETKRNMLYTSLDDNHLFRGLGSSCEDTVFTRSFSVLISPLILECNFSRPFLTEEDIRHVFNQMCRYFRGESDLRGYVEHKGWAHAVAHTSDAFETLVKCQGITKDDHLAIMDLILEKAQVNTHYYVDGEDERMAEVINTIIQRNLLGDDPIVAWVQKATKFKTIGKYPEDSIVRGNVRNLLRSVYFNTMRLNKDSKIPEAIVHALGPI